MKRYLINVLITISILAAVLINLGAQPAEEDSIKYYVNRLESLLQSELDKNQEIGRYQLQSFVVDRTHWHYILDTATGELYRLELSRTPENSKWMLMTAANFDRSSRILQAESE